jgi:non-heme chloroperoxidase
MHKYLVHPRDAGCVVASSHELAVSHGAQLRCDLIEDGPRDVVLLHGWSCDRRTWSLCLPHLRGLRIAVCDLAGHGESEGGAPGWTIERFARDIALLIDHLQMRQVTLVGHSMGGRVALEVAAHVPDRIAAVIAVDSITTGKLPSRLYRAAFAAYMSLLKRRFEPMIGREFGWMFRDDTDADLVRELTATILGTRRDVALDAWESSGLYPVGARLQSLRLPIWSVNSSALRVHDASLRSSRRDHEITRIEGTGHFLMLERPREVSAALQRLIERAAESH